MADVEVNIKLGFGDLKKGIKDAKEAIAKADFGSEAYNKATKSLQHLQEEMKNVTDAAKIQGSGVERLESSFGLLTEGLKTADFGAIKAGFKGIGQAMEAIPVLLLIEGIKELIDNFGEFKEIFKTLTGTFSEGEIEIKKLNNELERQKEATGNLSKALQREVDIMEAQGKSHSQILAKKKELIQSQIQEAYVTAKLNIAKAQEVQNNDSLIESVLKLQAETARKFGFDKKAEELEHAISVSKQERNKENIKTVKDSIELIKDLQTKQKVEEIKVETETYNKHKELQKKKDDEDKKAIEEARKLQADEADRMNASIDKEEADAKKLQESRAKNLDELKALQLKADQDEVAAFIEKERLMTAAKKAEDDARYNIEKQSVQSAQMLADVLFQAQIDGANGNEAKQLEIKRKAFEVNKAFQASQAGIDGVRATLNAYATAPPGFKIAAAISAGVFAAAQVAKILAAKFNAGTSAAPSNNINSGGSVSGGGAPLGGQIQQNTGIGDKSTTFNDKGQQTGNWISVVEINNTQKRVAKMSEQARF